MRVDPADACELDPRLLLEVVHGGAPGPGLEHVLCELAAIVRGIGQPERTIPDWRAMTGRAPSAYRAQLSAQEVALVQACPVGPWSPGMHTRDARRSAPGAQTTMMNSILLSALALIAAPQTLEDDLLAEVSRVHEKQSNVGVSVTLLHHGETAFTAFLGLADLEHDVPVTENTRFGIASITKLYTLVILLQMQDEIDLDASIHTLVPEYPRKEEGDITVRMLITHRSGIPHPQKRTPELFATHYDRALDALEVFADEPLLFEPGTQTSYSSSNYNLLAAAIEKVSRRPFTETVATRLLDPIGLEHTAFDDVLRPMSHRSRRYSFYHPWTYEESDELFVVPTWDYSFNAGGGNLAATSGDVARFGHALTSPEVLSVADFDQLFEFAGSTDSKGRPLLYLSGSNPGVQAGLAVYPEQELSVCVLANTWGRGSRSGEMTTLTTRLAEAFLQERD